MIEKGSKRIKNKNRVLAILRLSVALAALGTGSVWLGANYEKQADQIVTDTQIVQTNGENEELQEKQKLAKRASFCFSMGALFLTSGLTLGAFSLCKLRKYDSDEDEPKCIIHTFDDDENWDVGEIFEDFR